MPGSLLLFSCIALNIYLIIQYLLPGIFSTVHTLVTGLRRSSRYLTCRLTESRERALRQRTLKLIRQTATMILNLIILALGYSPSILFAHYRDNVADAFYSIETFSGMVAAIILCGIGKLKR